MKKPRGPVVGKNPFRKVTRVEIIPGEYGPFTLTETSKMGDRIRLYVGNAADITMTAYELELAIDFFWHLIEGLEGEDP